MWEELRAPLSYSIKNDRKVTQDGQNDTARWIVDHSLLIPQLE